MQLPYSFSKKVSIIKLKWLKRCPKKRVKWHKYHSRTDPAHIVGPKPVTMGASVKRKVAKSAPKTAEAMMLATGFNNFEARIGLRVIEILKENPNASTSDITALILHVPREQRLALAQKVPRDFSIEERPLALAGNDVIRKVRYVLTEKGIITPAKITYNKKVVKE